MTNRLCLKVLGVFVVLSSLSSGLFADEAVEQFEVQDASRLDSSLEADQNAQLKADQQFLAAETVKTERDIKNHKNKAAVLKHKNQRLTQLISKESADLKKRQRSLTNEERTTEVLERKVAAQEKWLEKVRIKAIEIRKRQDALRRKQAMLHHKAKIQQKRLSAINAKASRKDG